MGSPIAMMNKIAFASVSESEILSAVASSGNSLEFFDLTNIGCFPDVDFCGGGDFEKAKREIDAVLNGYGITFSPWQKINLPKEWADREGCVRYRWTNSIVHFDVLDCTKAI